MGPCEGKSQKATPLVRIEYVLKTWLVGFDWFWMGQPELHMLQGCCSVSHWSGKSFLHVWLEHQLWSAAKGTKATLNWWDTKLNMFKYQLLSEVFSKESGCAWMCGCVEVLKETPKAKSHNWNLLGEELKVKRPWSKATKRTLNNIIWVRRPQCLVCSVQRGPFSSASISLYPFRDKNNWEVYHIVNLKSNRKSLCAGYIALGSILGEFPFLEENKSHVWLLRKKLPWSCSISQQPT